MNPPDRIGVPHTYDPQKKGEHYRVPTEVQKARICKGSNCIGDQRKTTRQKALWSKNPAPSAPPKDFFDLLARLRLESATKQIAARESGIVRRGLQRLMTAMQTVNLQIRSMPRPYRSKAGVALALAQSVF
jgi:hypothetical protein